MKIKQDPATRLWCREDGAVLLPPTSKYSRFKTFRWTFGCETPNGYCRVYHCGKPYLVHKIICRAFHGLAPEGKPCVDHIDRCKSNNSASNLRYASYKENSANADRVDESIERYGVRACEDRLAYDRAYRERRKSEVA